VQSGTPLFALHELAGWETERMVQRYARLSGEHLAPYAERMAEHLGTFWAQQPVDDNQKPRKKRPHDIVSTAKIWWPRAELNHRRTDFQNWP